jgi:hypothetical protein
MAWRIKRLISRAINIPFISPHIFSLGVDLDLNVARSNLAAHIRGNARIFPASPISRIYLIVRSNVRYSDTRYQASFAARWTIARSLDDHLIARDHVKFPSLDSLAGSEFPRIKL